MTTNFGITKTTTPTKFGIPQVSPPQPKLSTPKFAGSYNPSTDIASPLKMSPSELSTPTELKIPPLGETEFLDMWDTLFPDTSIEDTISSFQQNDATAIDSFVDRLRDVGQTPETISFMKTLFPNITDAEMTEVFTGYDVTTSDNELVPDIYWKPDTAEQTMLKLGFTTQEELNKIKELNKKNVTMEDWLETYKSINPSVWKDIRYSEASRSLIAGIGDLYNTMAGAAGWINQRTGKTFNRSVFKDSLVKSWNEIGAFMQAESPAMTEWKGVETVIDPRFWTVNMVRQVPSQLALLVPSILTAGAGAGVAGAMKLGQFGTQILTALFGSGGMTVAESMMEAGGTYNQAVNMGMNEEEASNAAMSVMWKNMSTLSATNAIEFLTAFAPGGKTFNNALTKGLIRIAKNPAGKIISVTLTEAGEEMLQEIYQRQAVGLEVKWDDEMKMVALTGGVFGGVFGTSGAVYNALINNVQSSLSVEQRKQLETSILKGMDEGLTEEDATIRALDEIAGTKEGQQAIDTALKNLTKQIAQEELGRLGGESSGKLSMSEINQLKSMNYTDAEINSFTPEQVQRIIERGENIPTTVERGEEFLRANQIQPALEGTFKETVIPSETKLTEDKQAKLDSLYEKKADIESQIRAIDKKIPKRFGDELAREKMREVASYKMTKPKGQVFEQTATGKNVTKSYDLQGELQGIEEEIAKLETSETTGIKTEAGEGGGIPPTKPPVAQAPVPPSSMDDIVKKLSSAIREAKPAREITEELKHQELSRRAAIAASILKGGEGYKAFQKSKSALQGALPEADFAMDLEAQGITDEDITAMFDKIRLSDAPYFQKLNTAEALSDLLMGKLPTEGELILLERMFGPDLAKAILDKRTLWQKMKNIATEILNVPRTLQTIFDLSATLRQGGMAIGQPIEFSKAFVSELKVVFSDKNYRQIDAILKNTKYADKAELHKLYIAPIEESAALSQREEGFMGRILLKVPVISQIVKMSERTYNTFLNVLRMETWNSYCRKWEGTNKIWKDYDDLAKAINHLTGRGDLGKLENAGAILNAAFYSPRWIASRIQVPLDLITSTPAVRKVVARNLVAFVVTGIGLLSLAKLAGAEVEDDPRSADFGKIKVGNTRFDFWAGNLPYARLVAQLITGQRKTTASGQIIEVDRNDLVNNFIRSKLAPIPGLVWDLGQGSTFVGEELTAENADRIIFEKLTPLFIQDIVDAINDAGVAGVGYGIPGIFGVGVQTYEDNWNTEEDKLGLPVRSEFPPYTIEDEIYDAKDYYSKIIRYIGNSNYEMLSDKKNVPDKVLSVAEARDIKNELYLLPPTSYTGINADETEGDTYEQYYAQWQARSKIIDEQELKKFDEQYPDAYKGNMPQRTYALLQQYHSLDTAQEKYDFLLSNPELNVNPRDKYLVNHPEENAKLAIWGQAKVMTPEALTIAQKLLEELDIPGNAVEGLLPSERDTKFLKWYKEDATYNLVTASALGGGYEANQLVSDYREEYLKANPEYADDRRRIQAYGLDATDEIAELFVEYWRLSSSSAKLKFRSYHPNFETWGEEAFSWKPLESTSGGSTSSSSNGVETLFR
jgi:hypothetical protein